MNLHRFRGTVIDVMPGEWDAVITDLDTPDNPDEYAVFGLDVLDRCQRALCRRGATFEWRIWYDPAVETSGVGEIRFDGFDRTYISTQ